MMLSTRPDIRTFENWRLSRVGICHCDSDSHGALKAGAESGSMSLTSTVDAIPEHFLTRHREINYTYCPLSCLWLEENVDMNCVSLVSLG
jgi:hypothetical protein